MSSRFLDRHALVTGAASGIGRATALGLAREGAKVILVDRDAAGLAALAAETGGLALAFDVTDEGAWERALAQVPALDLAVLSAGISHGAPVVDMAYADWRRVMAVNLDGSFLGLRAAARAMRGRGRAERPCAIVLVSSASGRKATPGASAYAASKAGVSMLARSAALELAPEHIRVNAVLPGGVRTPLWESMPFFQDLVAQEGTVEAAWRAMEAGSPGPGQKRFAAPEEIADGILHLLDDASRFVTGIEFVMDGGYSA